MASTTRSSGGGGIYLNMLASRYQKTDSESPQQVKNVSPSPYQNFQSDPTLNLKTYSQSQYQKTETETPLQVKSFSQSPYQNFKSDPTMNIKTYSQSQYQKTETEPPLQVKSFSQSPYQKPEADPTLQMKRFSQTISQKHEAEPSLQIKSYSQTSYQKTESEPPVHIKSYPQPFYQKPDAEPPVQVKNYSQSFYQRSEAESPFQNKNFSQFPYQANEAGPPLQIKNYSQNINEKSATDTPLQFKRYSQTISQQSEAETPLHIKRYSQTISQKSDAEAPLQMKIYSQTISQQDDEGTSLQMKRYSQTISDKSEAEMPLKMKTYSQTISQKSEVETPLQIKNYSQPAYQKPVSEQPPQIQRYSQSISQQSEAEMPLQMKRYSQTISQKSEAETPLHMKRYSQTISQQSDAGPSQQIKSYSQPAFQKTTSEPPLNIQRYSQSISAEHKTEPPLHTKDYSQPPNQKVGAGPTLHIMNSSQPSSQQPYQKQGAEPPLHMKDYTQPHYQKHGAETPLHVTGYSQPPYQKPGSEPSLHLKDYSQSPYQKLGAETPLHVTGYSQPPNQKAGTGPTLHIMSSSLSSSQQSYQKQGAEPPLHMKDYTQSSYQKPGAETPLHVTGYSQPPYQKTGTEPPLHIKGYTQSPYQKPVAEPPLNTTGYPQRPYQQPGEESPLHIMGYSQSPYQKLVAEPPLQIKNYSYQSFQDDNIRHGGHTVSRTSHSENRYSGSGDVHTSEDYSSSHWEEAKNRQNAGFGGRPQQDIGGYGDVSHSKHVFESEPKAAPQKQMDIHQEVHSLEGGVYESQPQTFHQWQNEEELEEGVYESQPVKRDDVYREADTDRTADLPAIGTARSMREKFMSVQQEPVTHTRHEVISTVHDVGGEYISEPRGYVEKYEGKAEAGVFESQPVSNPDVITSNTVVEEVTYESGFARNTAAKFREMEKQSSSKKEITTGHEFEPRSHMNIYEQKVESGVFESEPIINPDVVRSGEEVREELPERGMARSIADRFLQISIENTSHSYSSKGKKEMTPDRTGREEYVSEPRAHMVSDYEAKVDAGVFENQPYRQADVVTSDSVKEEYIPERGFAMHVAAKFREMESAVKSPPHSPGKRKEFTPPRESERSHQAMVSENSPDFKSNIVHSDDALEETLPERGTARNMAQLFRQMEVENRSPHIPKAHKEFTPPPIDAGVYENQPKEFHAEYNMVAESGVIENEPMKRDDVIRGDDPPRYEQELPERGTAKNMVNRWRQMESEGAKLKSPPSGGRPKDFTPPRDEPRVEEHKKSSHGSFSSSSQVWLDNGSVHPSDLPGQYQHEHEAGVFESSPQQRADVVREADTDWTDGMPQKDTAKKMLARFQSIQAEANKPAPAPVSRKESVCSDTENYHEMDNTKEICEDENKVGRSKSMRAAIQMEKCGACEKTVYAMERLEMNKRVYHKACFRCTQCKAVLTPKTFAINNEIIFCTTHYKQLFATKGNYDEGFGRTQHKKRWSSNPNLAKDGESEENGES